MKAAMKGQTYGNDVNNTQNLVPSNSATASEFLPNGTYFLCSHFPVAAYRITLPNRLATNQSNSATSPTSTCSGSGMTHKQTSTLTKRTTTPIKPIAATRTLVSCKRATPRLIVPGIADVNASAMTNQKSTTRSRVPRYVGVQCGLNSPVGLRIMSRSSCW